MPLFLLAMASCVVTLAAQRNVLRPLEQLAFAARAANAAVAYVAYLGKMLYPADLAVFYPFPAGPSPILEVVAAVSLLSAISAAFFAARWKCPWLLVGWLWYLGTLAPVIGLVQVGGQAMADRYTYLTQIGIYIAIAWGVADAARSWPGRHWLLAAASALVAAGLMVCAWQQARHWRDSEALWNHTLACTSHNPFAENGLGLALADRGQVAEAIVHFQDAVDINPNYVDALNSLGHALAARGDVQGAIARYRKALAIQSDYVEAHNNLGLALVRCGDVEEAISHYREALAIQPDYLEAYNNLGIALAGRGDVGDIDEALVQFRRALKIGPDQLAVHYNLGSVLADHGEVDEAMVHFQRALEIQPDYAEAHYRLGLALARRGRLDEALAHYQKALELASARNNGALADIIRAQIESIR
jgi:tetratricopeptide (TPR) repeat protein